VPHNGAILLYFMIFIPNLVAGPLIIARLRVTTMYQPMQNIIYLSFNNYGTLFTAKKIKFFNWFIGTFSQTCPNWQIDFGLYKLFCCQ